MIPKKTFFNAIIKPQFSYCPLVWMFCSRHTNNMINKLHDRALRTVLDSHISDFETLLQKSNDIFSHHRNIQMFMIELYKVKNKLAPPIMNSVLNMINVICNFRNLQTFHSKRKWTAFYGLQTLSYCAPQLWTLWQEKIKQRNTICLFKSDVKQWICKECTCRLCKVFLPNLGFIWHMLASNYIFKVNNRNTRNMFKVNNRY